MRSWKENNEKKNTLFLFYSDEILGVYQSVYGGQSSAHRDGVGGGRRRARAACRVSTVRDDDGRPGRRHVPLGQRTSDGSSLVFDFFFFFITRAHQQYVLYTHTSVILYGHRFNKRRKKKNVFSSSFLTIFPRNNDESKDARYNTTSTDVLWYCLQTFFRRGGNRFSPPPIHAAREKTYRYYVIVQGRLRTPDFSIFVRAASSLGRENILKN